MNNVLLFISFFFFRNPYDIPRSNLLDQIARMRTNYLQKSYNITKLVDEGYLVFDNYFLSFLDNILIFS